MAKKSELANAPTCPVHTTKPMRLIPALPDLQPHRGVTGFDIKTRKQMNSWIRYKCAVPNCPYVAAIPIDDAA
jgi:hypothetical protein